MTKVTNVTEMQDGTFQLNMITEDGVRSVKLSNKTELLEFLSKNL